MTNNTGKSPLLAQLPYHRFFCLEWPRLKPSYLFMFNSFLKLPLSSFCFVLLELKFYIIYVMSIFFLFLFFFYWHFLMYWTNIANKEHRITCTSFWKSFLTLPQQLTRASFSIACKSCFTCACVRSCRIATRRIDVTTVRVGRTLVDICMRTSKLRRALE